MGENRNLLVAFLLSAALILGWEYFVAMPQMRAQQHKQELLAQQEKKSADVGKVSAPQPEGPTAKEMSRDAALGASGKRIAILTPKLDGSLRLTGGTFDDLRLRDYHETIDKKSPEIALLAPAGTKYPYFANFGWVGAPGSKVAVPGTGTVWTQVGNNALTEKTPVALTWNNGQGLVFTRTISVDSQYLFTVADKVENKGASKATLFPYAAVTRRNLPVSQRYWVLHEGFVGVAGGKLNDPKYDDFKDDTPPETFRSTGGWAGITDKYWMAAVVPPQGEAFDGSFNVSNKQGGKDYQADYRLGARDIAPGETASVTQRLFAGAKVVKTLRDYQDRYGIDHFDLAIDWGWFWFFTKPIFWLLDVVGNYLSSHGIAASFGIAILILTVVIRGALYPMANAGFKQMTRMKKLQPELERLKERHGDDKAKQQQEMMALYQREKVNPVSGCLPMLVQIPVMFSLYKVLIVTIEMYHAPFFGWIHDLSAPDPTSWINLFGLLPFDPHAVLPSAVAFLSIGIWPILLGITQWVQTKMNPPPPDPATAQMFTYMPILFTFMFAAFPAGLVIYYAWSNLLTMAQQYVMMRRHGVEIHLFNNLSLAKGKIPDIVSDDGAVSIENVRKLFSGPCEFVWGTGNIESLPPQTLPEVAFVGRSNAGKSSLINAIANRKALARVSHTPGRTREINFFDLGGKLMLVDLPGYGYARASKSLSAEWQRLIFAYLRGRANLRRVMLLIDSRRGLMDTDRAVMDLLDESAVSYVVVLTKTDELKKGEFAGAVAAVDGEARKHTAAFPDIFATSAHAKEGLDALKTHLAALAGPANFGL